MAEENSRDNNNSTKDIMHKGLFGRAIGNGWWKFKFYSRIPQDYVLIKRCKFSNAKTKLIVERKKHFINPFMYDVKLISDKEKRMDYKPRKFQAADGTEVNIDNVVFYRVVDWNLFDKYSENPIQVLQDEFESGLRTLVRNYDWALLEKQSFKLPDIEKFKDGKWYSNVITDAYGNKTGNLVRKVNNPNSHSQEDFDKDLANFIAEMKAELSKYGIDITKIRLKEIHTSKENEAQQERLNNEKREKAIAIAEGERKLAQATYEAKVTLTKAQAETDAFNIEYDNLINHGLTSEQATSFIIRKKLAGNDNVAVTAQSSYGAMQGVAQAATADAISNARRI